MFMCTDIGTSANNDVMGLEWRPVGFPGLPAVENDGRGPGRLADGCRGKGEGEREGRGEEERGGYG